MRRTRRHPANEVFCREKIVKVRGNQRPSDRMILGRDATMNVTEEIIVFEEMIPDQRRFKPVDLKQRSKDILESVDPSPKVI